MHAGLRASNLCVSRLLFLHPTQAVFNGKDQKFGTTILAIGWRSSSALLPAKRSGATCVWSSPFFILPKPGGKIKTQKKLKEFRTRTAGFCGERQDKQADLTEIRTESAT